MRARAWVIVLTWSCQSAPAEGPPGSACAPAAESARTRVHAIADENRACTVDADCVRVPALASCFSACTEAVNLVGKGAVERANILVEAHECRIFRDADCALAEVACPPVAPATCRAGRCE